MLITACPGDLEILQQKQKEEMRKTRNPCSLGPSPVCLHQARHAPVLPVVLTGPSRAGMSFASLQRVPLVLPSLRWLLSLWAIPGSEELTPSESKVLKEAL